VATETLYPDAIITQTGLSGAVSTVNSAEDGTWMTTNASGSTLRVSFSTPTGNPTTGTGVQSFRLYVRKNAAGGGDPIIDSVELYEGGTLRQTLGGTPITVTSATGTAYTFSWDAANLVTADGSGVEIRVVASKGGGGPNERNVEYDSVSWAVDYTVAATVIDSGAVSGSGAGTSSAAGIRAVLGVVSGAAGVGTAASTGVLNVDADATGNGAGTGTASGLLTSFASSSSPGVGSSTGTALLVIPTLASPSAGVGSSSASGAVRKTAAALPAAGVGTSTASGTVFEVGSSNLSPSGTASTSGLVNELGGTANLHLSVDDTFGLEDDDSTYVVNSGRSDGVLTVELSNLPPNYDSMESISVRIRVRRA